jgi:hypothetical protein
VGQVRQETEAELIAVRSQIDVVSSSFETKLVQAHSQAQDNADRLSSQIITNRAEVEASNTQLNRDVDHKLTRQGERLREINQVLDQEKANTQTRFEQVNAKIASLETKISEVPSRTVTTTDSRSSSSNPFSPSVVNQDGTVSEHIINNVNHGTANENRDGSGQSSVENVCMQNIVHESGMNVTTINPSMSSFLSNSELPLPLFDDSSEINPVLHLRKLDEFMRLKCIPKHYQLAIAYRSIVGQLCSQWVETVSCNLSDYDAFRSAFLKTWWSDSHQSLVRCKLYQGRYNRSSNLSLSGYFLKYATMASYLNPRPSDIEVIEAIRYHFPVNIQRAMLSNQLRTIDDTLVLLRRVEVLETGEAFPRPHQVPQNQSQNAPRQGANPSANDRRGPAPNHVRQLQSYQNNRNKNNWNNRRYHYNNNRNRESESESPGSNQLNPNATSFQGRQQPSQASNPGTSRSEN